MTITRSVRYLTHSPSQDGSHANHAFVDRAKAFRGPAFDLMVEILAFAFTVVLVLLWTLLWLLPI